MSHIGHFSRGRSSICPPPFGHAILSGVHEVGEYVHDISVRCDAFGVHFGSGEGRTLVLDCVCRVFFCLTEACAVVHVFVCFFLQ